MVGPRRCGAEPQIPVERRGGVVLIERPLDRLRPDRPVGPQLDLAHGADQPGLHPLADQACAFFGMSLIPHLRLDFVAPRCVLELLHFPQRAGQRLLNARVLAEFHRHHAGNGVGMIGRRDGDGVDALSFFIEQDPEILEPLGEGKGRERLRPLALVDIAQRVDILGLPHAAHVVRPHPADADASDVELVARRQPTPPARAQHVRRDDRECDTAGDVTHKLATRNGVGVAPARRFAHGSTRILMLRKATTLP